MALPRLVFGRSWWSKDSVEGPNARRGGAGSKASEEDREPCDRIRDSASSSAHISTLLCVAVLLGDVVVHAARSSATKSGS